MRRREDSSRKLRRGGRRRSQRLRQRGQAGGVRLAVRRCATEWTGKKPVVDVLVPGRDLNEVPVDSCPSTSCSGLCACSWSFPSVGRRGGGWRLRPATRQAGLTGSASDGGAAGDDLSAVALVVLLELSVRWVTTKLDGAGKYPPYGSLWEGTMRAWGGVAALIGVWRARGTVAPSTPPPHFVVPLPPRHGEQFTPDRSIAWASAT